MIKVNILYPNKAGGRFDHNYYIHTHMPTAIKKLGPALKGVSVERGISGVTPGSEPTYIAGCHYTFDTIEAFLEAFMPHATELQGDIANYTNIDPIIQFSEIGISQQSSETASMHELRNQRT